MKTNILTRTIAALLIAAPIAEADDKKPEEKKEGKKEVNASASTSVIASADGTATVTIDVNGKKETRTFKLGDGTNSFSFSTDGDGATAGGVVRGGGNMPFPGQGKREKGPWMGIGMEPVQEVVRAQLSLAPGEGIVINHVMPESPAAKAGLQPNDILLRFEDQIVLEPSQLRKLIAMKKPGDTVKLIYLRKGERKDASVALVEHEIEPGEGGPMPWFGNHPGVFHLPVPAPGMMKPLDPQHPEEQHQPFKDRRPEMGKRLEGLQDQLRQMKEKHPGVVVEKREWLSGSPEQMLQGQIDKLLRSLEESQLPREQIDNLRKELDHARREASEAMDRAKRGTEDAVKNAQRALEEASRALNESRKGREKEKGDQPKKPGEPL